MKTLSPTKGRLSLQRGATWILVIISSLKTPFRETIKPERTDHTVDRHRRTSLHVGRSLCQARRAQQGSTNTESWPLEGRGHVHKRVEGDGCREKNKAGRRGNLGLRHSGRAEDAAASLVSARPGDPDDR